MKKLCFIVMFISVLCFSNSAYSLELGARGYYWFPELGGDSKVDYNDIIGSVIDFSDDLNIDDEAYPIIEAFAGIGKHHWSISAMQVDYSGSIKFANPVIFKGRSFGGVVESDLKYDMIDVEYQYDLINFENILAGFSIGAIGKIKWLDGEVELSSNTEHEKASFQAPIPMIGAGIHVGLIADILEARVKITGIGYSGNLFYDAMADISFTPFPFLDIHAGYRIMDLDADIDDIALNYYMAGPYVAITIGF